MTHYQPRPKGRPPATEYFVGGHWMPASVAAANMGVSIPTIRNDPRIKTRKTKAQK